VFIRTRSGFNQADVCHQWTVSTFPLECRYPRIPIKMRNLGKVIPRFFRRQSCVRMIG
jgi:hypothetical protein